MKIETLLKTDDLEVTRSEHGTISFACNDKTSALFDLFGRITELEEQLQMEVTFHIPEKTGIYWYYNHGINDFQACDIQSDGGKNKVLFINGMVQRFVEEKCYFVGPINKPMINESGQVVTSLHSEM